MTVAPQVRLVGGKQIISKLRKTRDDSPEAAGNALLAAGFGIMQLAKELAPYEEGDLENSGYVKDPTRAGTAGAVVELGFGGRAGDYVQVQHENEAYNHPGERALALGVTKVGIAKWLEQAIAIRLHQSRRIIQDHYRHFVQTGKIRTPKRGNIPSDQWGG